METKWNTVWIFKVVTVSPVKLISPEDAINSLSTIKKYLISAPSCTQMQRAYK